jgi:hypothetical protein
VKPTEAREEPIFIWETMKEIRRQDFQWEDRTVPGLQTKNGIQPETNMTLRALVATDYGEAYNVYRPKRI